MADSLLSRSGHCDELADLIEILRRPDSEVAIARAFSQRRHANERLSRIRALRLEYLAPYIEPLDAKRWLEGGGKRTEAVYEGAEAQRHDR